MTLAELRTAARQRADQVNSEFVTDTELNGYINSSYFELYDLLVQKYGDDYFVTSDSSIVTDGQNDSYALPADFFKLLGVDLQLSGTAGADNGSYVPLDRFNFAERNVAGTATAQGVLARTNLRYRPRGSTLWLTPLPAAGQTIRLWYVPRLTPLSSDSDSADGVSGWLEYVVCDVAIKMMQKEESDVSVLMAQKAALIERIEAAAENRDAGMPQTVADVRSGLWGGAWEGEPWPYT